MDFYVFYFLMWFLFVFAVSDPLQSEMVRKHTTGGQWSAYPSVCLGAGDSPLLKSGWAPSSLLCMAKEALPKPLCDS